MTLRPAAARITWLVGGAVLVVAACVLALVVGPTDIPRGGVLRESVDRLTPFAVDSGLSTTQESIVWNLSLIHI